jgi:hypothetical protein
MTRIVSLRSRRSSRTLSGYVVGQSQCARGKCRFSSVARQPTSNRATGRARMEPDASRGPETPRHDQLCTSLFECSGQCTKPLRPPSGYTNLSFELQGSLRNDSVDQEEGAKQGSGPQLTNGSFDCLPPPSRVRRRCGSGPGVFLNLGLP